MKNHLPRIGLICGLMLLVGLPALFAQPVRPKRPRFLTSAWLHLRFDQRGFARTELQLPFPPPQPEQWQQLLATALGHPLQKIRWETRGSTSTLHVRADAVLSRDGWAIEGNLDLNPLREQLSLVGVGALHVTIEHPSAEFHESSSHQTTPWPTLSDTGYSLTLDTAEPLQPLHLWFGYGRQSLWRFLPLAFVLLVPIGLTLWRRRVKPNEGDRFVAWFRYWRFQRWLNTAIWCLWVAGVASLGVLGLTRFLVGEIFAQGEYVWVVFFLAVPPMLATLLCDVLSAPAYARVPEVGWTRGRLLRQGLWLLLGFMGTAVCIGKGVDSLSAEPDEHAGLLYFLSALGPLLLGVIGAALSRGNLMQVLSPGPVRERLFELADQARLRMRQAYRVSPASWRLVNAVGFADCAHVCADLLPHMSRREADALLALELAWLWRRNRRSLGQGLAGFGVTILIGAGIGVLAVFVGNGILWPLLPLVLIATFLWRFRQPPQHFMARLDREALKITGDPEALITALAKLRRLNLLPLVVGEKRNANAGPVEDWTRLHDLADRAGIPPERLDEILAGPGSGADRYPPLESAPDLEEGADPRVFSREFKRRSLSRQFWTGVVVEIAVPVLLAYLAQKQHWHGGLLALIYLAGVPLTLFLRKTIVSRLAVHASHALRRGLRKKLARDGLSPEAWDGISVSLSPHGEPRLYENFLIWDPGFLVLSGDRLCYLGDHTRFALERRHIREVYLGPGGPGWPPNRRVYVSWWDAERGIGGVFNLIDNARQTWLRSAAQQIELARWLSTWLKQPADAEEIPPPLRALSSPDFGAVPSESLGKFASGHILITLLFNRVPFVLVACWLLGLSFDVHHGAGGWYVLGSTALLAVLTVLSFLPYRGRERDAIDKDAPTPGSD